MLCFYDPNNHLKLALDSPNGREEPEELLWLAQSSGLYRLEVHSWEERDDSSQKYSLTVGVTRRASGRDLDRLAATLAGTTAEALRRSGDPKGWLRAREEYSKALAIWQRLGDRLREGDLFFRLGRLQAEKLSDPNRALLSYSRAHALFAQFGERRRDLRTVDALAKLCQRLDRYSEALGFREEMLRVSRELNDAWSQAVSFNEIGVLEDLLGEPSKSLEAYFEALAIWSRLGNDKEKSITLYNRAHLYSSLGKYQEALDDWERARVLNPGKPVDQAVILTSMGTTYTLLGQPDKALPLLEQALSWRISSRDRIGQAKTETSLGFALLKLGRLTEALTHQRQALAIFQRFGSAQDKSHALHNYGLALKDLGRFSEAAPLLKSAVNLGRHSGDERLVQASLFALAQIQRSQGDPLVALNLVREALESIESNRLKSPSPNLRATFFATKQDYYDFTVELLMEIDRKAPEKGYAVEAFDLSERSRARSLLELLQESGIELRDSVPAKLADAKSRLEIAIRAKSRSLILQQLMAPDQTSGQELELRGLLRDYDQVNAEIRTQSPSYRSLMQAQPLTLQQIQRQVLASDTLLLYYKLGKESSYLWAVTPNSIEHFTLPSRDVLERQAERAYRLLSTPISQAQAEITLRKLSELLLAPVRERLGGKRLLIVGEGALQYIPFEALPQPGADDRSRPLVVDHEIVTMPSASALAMLKSQQSGRKLASKQIAILADPVFSVDDPRIPIRRPAGLVSGSSVGSLFLWGLPAYHRLRYSRLEAESISSVGINGEVLKAFDFAASRRTVLSGVLSNYRIIHFSTHGEADSTHPELSRLVLSLVDEEGRLQDGFLYAHEIFGLHLPAELVVLSACQTGLGHEIRGEGLVGLPQAFLYAGAARVVVSLWNVDDRATAHLFQSFYRHLLLEHMTPSQALRTAQIEQWRKQPWPYHWAAFVIQGRWR